MALLETETGNYYKINFDECSVRGLKVYVAFNTYLTPNDREKEKQRLPLIAEFGDKLQRLCAESYQNLIDDITVLGLEPKDVADENGDVNAEKYPGLRCRQIEINKIQEFYQKFYDALYVYVSDNQRQRESIIINEEIKDSLDAIGYDETWIIDPIRLGMGAEVECGDYKGEEINHELFYNRLKTVMSEDVTDC